MFGISNKIKSYKIMRYVFFCYYYNNKRAFLLFCFSKKRVVLISNS